MATPAFTQVDWGVRIIARHRSDRFEAADKYFSPSV